MSRLLRERKNDIMSDYQPGRFEQFGNWGTYLLRLLPAEVAHSIGMNLLTSTFFLHLPDPNLDVADVDLETNAGVLGVLKHPLGLAAGFDKNMEAPYGFAKMGFSCLEFGTVTPQSQPGNSKPRMWRDSETKSIVNRMGFNNDGAIVLQKRLQSLNWTTHHPKIGLNIGKNKQTSAGEAIGDYVGLAQRFAPISNYLVVNLSSPNTPGLRDLATSDFIDLLAKELGSSILSKTFVKLDPDLSKSQLQKLIERLQHHVFAGVILTNTHGVQSPYAGGLSGHSLLSQSNSSLEWAWETHLGSFTMIASGGVLTGMDAFSKIARGASLVQLYSALVFRGPGAVAKILWELGAEMRRRGFRSVDEAKGSFYDKRN